MTRHGFSQANGVYDGFMKSIESYQRPTNENEDNEDFYSSFLRKRNMSKELLISVLSKVGISMPKSSLKDQLIEKVRSKLPTFRAWNDFIGTLTE